MGSGDSPAGRGELIWTGIRQPAPRPSPWGRFRRWFLVDRREENWIANVPALEPDERRVGICCSGGGVRSAAYNLGALQVLREEGVLEKADYLSAVSGGSYIAAAFTSLTSKTPDAEAKRKPIYSPASPEEEFLRNHSSYLAPGLAGKGRLLLRVLLGMIVNLVLVAVAVAVVTIPVGWLARALYPQLANPSASGGLHLQLWMWLTPASAAGLGCLLALPDLLVNLEKDDVRRRLEAWTTRMIGLGLALGVLMLLVPQVLLLAREVGHASVAEVTQLAKAAERKPAQKATGLLQLINVGAIATAVLGALRAFVARKRSFFVLAAAAIAGPLAVLAPALWVLNESAAVGPSDTSMLVAIAVLAAVAVVLWLAADLTQWSLHPFYRRRLNSAFFVERTGIGESDEPAAEEIPYEEALKWSEMRPSATFPELIVCAAANVSDEGATPPGRWATPFTFTRQEIGGPAGVSKTKRYEKAANNFAERPITLPAAVAMSGAAVSPAMGKKTIRAMSFLLALTNVRLGVWVPNPRYLDELKESRFEPVTRVLRRILRRPEGWHPRVRWPWPQTFFARATRWLWTRVARRRATPLYLFKELFGLTSVEDSFLYVTDGGHYDNLGLIELLRRGCTTIFCLDAGGDRIGTYRALGEAIALARSDLQVDIEIDPTPLKPDENRISETDSVIGRFRFRATHERAVADPVAADLDTKWMGELVYCRATVTEDAPWDVRDYQEREKHFPYDSTFDQLFDDEKFESYRALGAHTARQAVLRWHRKVARDAVREVLQRTARKRATIRHAALFKRVSEQLKIAKLPSLLPLLDEIREAEELAERPPLVLVIQEAEVEDGELKTLLKDVYTYWAPNGAGASAR